MLLAALTSACVTSPESNFPEAPYPRSRVIRSIRWDLSTVNTMRSALGSDIWPTTWGADGEIYTAWGDGGGFEGKETSRQEGRASLGFARITGIPRVGRPSSIQGHNIWGTRPYADNQATFGGKIGDLISVDGTLYAQGGVWTRDNCACPDPTQRSGSADIRTLAWSSDFGKSWTLAPWTSGTDQGATLQFGPDYRGALDPLHVYFYYQKDVKSEPTRLYLRRVRTDALAASPATPGHFEYFSGLAPDDAPRWSADESDAAPVFVDSRVPPGTYIGPAVVHDAALGRYVMVAFHGPLTGQIGLFESATPWGPWATLAYYENWGGFNQTASEGNGMTFPAKWISPDGRTLWAVFSGLKTSEVNFFDSFNVARLTLHTGRSLPRIKSPAAGRTLSAGAVVAARGSGSRLTWSASLVRMERDRAVFEPLAQGTGSSFRFTVPADVGPGRFIRLSLTAGNADRVYYDYPVLSAR